MLELDAVSENYRGPGEVVHAVTAVSMSVDPGEFVAILGPSGSGKSTLLLLASGILHPDEGHVRFRGEDISSMSDRDAATYRRKHLGFIFQQFNLTPGTASENGALPLRLEGHKPRFALTRAEELLDEVGVAHRVHHQANQLSGGEKQRVAIAHALASSPQLVLADEPTGNLESERGTQVLGLLQSLCKDRGTAVVLVTHDVRTRDYADHIHLMKDGCLSGESNVVGDAHEASTGSRPE